MPTEVRILVWDFPVRKSNKMNNIALTMNSNHYTIHLNENIAILVVVHLSAMVWVESSIAQQRQFTGISESDRAIRGYCTLGAIGNNKACASTEYEVVSIHRFEVSIPEYGVPRERRGTEYQPCQSKFPHLTFPMNFPCRIIEG
jgi:hypothetical protein